MSPFEEIRKIIEEKIIGKVKNEHRAMQWFIYLPHNKQCEYELKYGAKYGSPKMAKKAQNILEMYKKEAKQTDNYGKLPESSNKFF